MEFDKEDLELTKELPSGKEVIKTRISFNKGMIAGIMILIIVVCIGILIGYGIGEFVAAKFYTVQLAEQTKNCIKLNI